MDSSDAFSDDSTVQVINSAIFLPAVSISTIFLLMVPISTIFLLVASIFRDCTLCLCEVVAEQLPEDDKVVFLFHDYQHYDYHDHDSCPRTTRWSFFMIINIMITTIISSEMIN